jgi:hypothetical protein
VAPERLPLGSLVDAGGGLGHLASSQGDCLPSLAE